MNPENPPSPRTGVPDDADQREGQVVIIAIGSAGVLGEEQFTIMPDDALVVNAGQFDSWSDGA